MNEYKLKKLFFDIRPFKEGNLTSAGNELDLRTMKNTPEIKPESSGTDQTFQKVGGDLDDLISDIVDVEPHKIVGEELMAMFERVDEPLVELARIGASFNPSKPFNLNIVKPQNHNDQKPQKDPPMFGCSTSKHASKHEEEGFYDNILAKIKEPIGSRVAFMASSVKPVVVAGAMFEGSALKEEKSARAKANSLKTGEARIIKEELVATAVEDFYNRTSSINSDEMPEVTFASQDFSKNKKALNFTGPIKKKYTGLWLAMLIAIGFTAYGLTLKNELLDGSSVAFENLENAGQDFKQFKFSEAAKNFGKSYQELSQISQTMNFMGAGLIGIFPGTEKVKSAKDMVEAGKLIAQSGEAMSRALTLFSQTGSVLNPSDSTAEKPVTIISQIKTALSLSVRNFQKAKALISGIDESAVPEDKKESFGDFKNKIPILEEYLDNAVKYTDFLEGIVGIDKPRKYLLLFNNNSELRPTGGFPGTYGVVSFAGGGLSDFFVNDVYNLDGQIKRNVIPPKQLQHITPTLGMRDASWFIDFPTSAKKAMEFFAEESGYGVNGVIALNPDIVVGILKIVGPVKMPEYGLTLSADNFVENVQEEVEYGNNREQPKKVVVDFAPRFLAKLYNADSDQWMKIFDVFMAGLDEKDILLYFNDRDLESFSIDEGFGGEIKDLPTGESSDYLMVNFSNIKGSKTDVVTDSAISIDSRFEDGSVIHKVTIIRDHKGGDHEHGFYNRQNPAYVRVLLSQDAELLGISGNDLPNFKPLLNYGLATDFEKDGDLARFESTFSGSNFPGVDEFNEGGKKGIGFWMITDPKTTKKVEFEYMVPLYKGTMSDYSFYFQKQPGLDWKNFVFKINKSDDYNIVSTMPNFNKIGGLSVFDELLKKDLEIKIKLEKK